MGRISRVMATCAATMIAAVAQADPLLNASRFGVDMRAGPGFQFPLIHVLGPGEIAERGRCDLGGSWCLLTAGDRIGWVDTAGLVSPGAAASRSAPLSGIGTATIESTPLGPGPSDGVLPDAALSRPLPGAITDAVRGISGGDGRLRPPPPGARLPFMFSTDVPFYNVTDGLVNLRAGPATDTEILAELAPGQGGTIDICDAEQRWCRMAVDGGPVAWVKMTLVGLRRIDVPPLAPSDVAAR